MKEARRGTCWEVCTKQNSEIQNNCALYNQDTAQKNEPPSYTRLMEEPMPHMTGHAIGHPRKSDDRSKMKTENTGILISGWQKKTVIQRRLMQFQT